MNTSDKKAPTPSTGAVALLIATRKGAWVLKSRDGRRNWELARNSQPLEQVEPLQ